jgi:ribosomal protein S26
VEPVSLSYETQQAVVETYAERTIRQVGWVSKYRILETIHRVIVTMVTVELVAPDGQTVVSRYVVPTRYVETEYRRADTVFLGVVRVGDVTPATPTRERRVEIQPQPVPISMAA